jgi:hypothetical protein
VEAVYRDAGAGQFLGEVEGVGDQRQLRTAVGVDAGVAVLEHRVVQVEQFLPDRRHVDHPGRRRPLQRRQQQASQQVRRQ